MTVDADKLRILEFFHGLNTSNYDLLKQIVTPDFKFNTDEHEDFNLIQTLELSITVKHDFNYSITDINALDKTTYETVGHLEILDADERVSAKIFSRSIIIIANNLISNAAFGVAALDVEREILNKVQAKLIRKANLSKPSPKN